MTIHNKRSTNIAMVVGLVAAAIMPAMLVMQADAASLTRTEVRFDRMKISTATTGTVCAMPATTATEADVQVTFPTGYTVSTTTANWAVSTTNLAWPTGANAWPSIATATAASGQTVTFPSGDLTVGTLYCFNWTNTAALSIKGSASSDNTGTVVTRASGPTNIDTGTYATASITDDQIVVSATVPQTFSFALSGNTDNLGTLSAASVSSSPSPRTVTLNTNANNGWQVWARDSATGLSSAATSHTIASTTPGTNSTIASGSEGYNMGVTSSQAGGSGTITVATPFVGGSTGRGGGLDTSLRTVATSTGTAQNAVLTLTNNAAISSLTPAASDYTDTITVIGAGLF